MLCICFHGSIQKRENPHTNTHKRKLSFRSDHRSDGKTVAKLVDTKNGVEFGSPEELPAIERNKSFMEMWNSIKTHPVWE